MAVAPGRGSGFRHFLDITNVIRDAVNVTYLDTGVPGSLECGDARGVAGVLTPTALLAVASDMWQAWLP